MRKHRPLSGSLFGCLLGCAILSLPAMAQTTSPNEWTWMGGSSTTNQSGVYGTLGTPAAGNTPGSRADAVAWTDSSGNLWLFGGGGYPASGSGGLLNDLWVFDPSTNEWTWMSGSNASYQSGAYGTLGTPAAGNVPGARVDALGWTDKSGLLWLFGGDGVDTNGNRGYLNDLWVFNPSTHEWTWMGGSSTCNQPGVSGTLGMPAAGNIPGSRQYAVSWTDRSGDFWLFGGEGFGATGGSGALDDLWKFSFSTKEWAWMGEGVPFGVYGTLGVPADGNVPGGRVGATSWTDSGGHLWLFGGVDLYTLDDLWEFNPLTNEWVWMGGSAEVACYPNHGDSCGQTGVYGTLGTPTAGNTPGSRSDPASWTDSSGILWLFGGAKVVGTAYGGNQCCGNPNDLWMFNPSTNEWAWMGGSGTDLNGGGLPGVYGTLGIPSTGNVPGGREYTASWTDGNGNLWFFGGLGWDATGNRGSLNDMWKYQPYANAATPAFGVASGTYTSTQTVSITDATAGANVYYTTDGTTPTTNSTQYTGPIVVMVSETIQTIAVATNFVNSAVASATYTIPPDFTVALNPPLISVPAGQSGAATITVQDEGGFNGNVSFACSGLPAGAACSFSTLTVPTPAGISYTTLTVTTAATTAALHRKNSPLFPGSVLAVALCCFGWKKRRRLPMLLLLAVSVAGMGLLNGCGGSSSIATSSQPVTSTVTVTATSGSLAHTAAFSLTVY